MFKINIFGVPDTLSHTNKFVPDIKEIVTNLYQTIISRLGVVVCRNRFGFSCRKINK